MFSFFCLGTKCQASSTRLSGSSKIKGDAQGVPFDFWWNRPVTAHYHEKDYMGIVGKRSIITTIISITLCMIETYAKKI